MKFLVYHGRVSDGWPTPPKNAQRLDYLRIEKRVADDPAKVPYYQGETGWWYGQGQNHRVEDGMITRDMPDAIWVEEVEVDSIEKLVAMADGDDVLIYRRDHLPKHFFIDTSHACSE